MVEVRIKPEKYRVVLVDNQVQRVEVTKGESSAKQVKSDRTRFFTTVLLSQ